MDHAQLRVRLAALGLATGAGDWDQEDRAAVLDALTSGPDYPLTGGDVGAAAARLRVGQAWIWASWDVESTGSPFIGGRPTILFEPHRFSRATGHRYDASHPQISSRSWNRALYPRTQGERYRQLLDAVALDVDAGFASASYGGFQILGENYAVCGATSPWSFAWRQAQAEGDQLEAYVAFVEGNGLAPALRACKPNDPASCVSFVDRYNGTAFRQNNYHIRFSHGIARRLGQ